MFTSLIVSIHTLHELEARIKLAETLTVRDAEFPFIRFTNWKQAREEREGPPPLDVSIHTLHELEASVAEVLERAYVKKFPFIRFTNWKQD